LNGRCEMAFHHALTVAVEAAIPNPGFVFRTPSRRG
jgi:hypothetical protein